MAADYPALIVELDALQTESLALDPDADTFSRGKRADLFRRLIAVVKTLAEAQAEL